MTNRRTFIKSSAAIASGAAFCGNATAEPQKSKAAQFGVGGYNYRLPGFKRGSRLLFQGDSITDMNRGRNENDRNHHLGHGYVYLIAARLNVEMAEAQLDFLNRGISGHTVADLRGRWQSDAIDLEPDLLSILVGANDAARGIQPEAFESDYRYILDAGRERNSELRLVLLDPFVLRSGRLKDEDQWIARRAATEKLRVVVARLAKDYKAVHIKTQHIFDVAATAVSPDQWIWDGVHPLPQGHELIARNWLQEVSARWPHA
jgi:lysophospholipase L1-like esterase